MRECLDCGKELRDVDIVCTECGSENLSLIEEENTQKDKNPKGALIILIAVLIIGILSSVIVYKSSQSTIPAKPIESAMAAFYSGDLQGYIDEMYGEFKTDAENYLTQEYESFISFEESTIETLKSAFGDNYKIETKVVDVFDYSDKIIQFTNDACADCGYDALITDLCHVTIRIVISNDEGAQSCYLADEYSAQIGGKWYFLPQGLLVNN